MTAHLLYIRPAETIIGIRLDGDESHRTHQVSVLDGKPLVVSHVTVISTPVVGEDAPRLEVHVHGFWGDHRGETVYATHPAQDGTQYLLRFCPGFVKSALRQHVPGAEKVGALNGTGQPHIEGLNC